MIKGTIRSNKYTPAVTRVEECTRAETGVGAAMAAGSQALKGIWALFVQAASLKHISKTSGEVAKDCEAGRKENEE